MSKLEEDRKRISKALEHEEGKRIDSAYELRCSQDMFNEGILEALASLRKGNMTHDERVDFLSWAEKEIQEEMEKESEKL